jgi:hypothetical protein
LLAVARAVSEPSTNAALYGLVGVLVGTAISAIANYAIAWGNRRATTQIAALYTLQDRAPELRDEFERGERKRSTPESQPTDSTGLLSALRS